MSMKRWKLMLLILTLILGLTGCGSLPGLSGEELAAVRQQYGLWNAQMSLVEVLDWADAVVQVEVLHDNALPEMLEDEPCAVAVHVQQAICGSVADSKGVDDRRTAVIWQEEDDPEMQQGQWLIMAVRERVLDNGKTVLDCDPSLAFYLHEEKYMIAATADNESAMLDGHTLEGLTEQLWPMYHPGQTQFSRSLLDTAQQEAILEASPFVRNEDALRMDYGRMREILRRCSKDEMRLDLMLVQQEGLLTLEEELYPGGGMRIQQLPEDMELPAGCRVVTAGDEVIYGVNDDDQLICLTPEAGTFTLTGITIKEYKDGLKLIAP